MPKTRVQLAVEMLKKHPDASKHRVAMLLAAKHSAMFKSVESARTTVRAVTGTQGAKSRKEYKTRTANTAREGSKVYALPRSKAKEWLPFEIGSGTHAVLGDIHFPKHDEKALIAAVKSIHEKHSKIDTVILNGDITDAEEFSSWAKNPRAVDSTSSLDCSRQGLLWLLDQFPDSDFIYKFGNHEERLERYCWKNAPELVGLPHITWEGLLSIDSELKPVDEFRRIKFVKDQRPILTGKLPILHGHELPKALVSSVNPARGAFLRVIDTVLVNHFHRSSSHVEYTWKHEPINCWSLGCLCWLNPEYARINKWNHGWAVVDVTKSGDFNVCNYKLIKDGVAVMA
jgi:predicted phosphodiesterase